MGLLDRVDERGQALDPDVQPVARAYRPDATRRAREDDIAGEQGQVGGNETDQMEAIENKLRGVRVLAQLPILEELDGQAVRVDLGLYVRAEWRKRVKGFAPAPLALGVLDGPVADVLRGAIAKDIASSGGRCDVAHPPANDNGQLRFVIGAMIRKRDFDLCPIRDDGGRGLKPKKRLFGQRFARFPRMVGVVQAHGDYLGRTDWSQGAIALDPRRLPVK